MKIESQLQLDTNTYMNIRQKLIYNADLKILFTVLECNPNSTHQLLYIYWAIVNVNLLSEIIHVFNFK